MKHLLYLHTQDLKCTAHVTNTEKLEDGLYALELHQTVFYPQGGGQPYDKGSIKKQDAVFNVEEVRKNGERVLHIGKFSQGSLKPSDTVECNVDAVRRRLNSRYHSGGHVLDMALTELGIDWTPVKGHHVPGEAYDEYEGEIGTRDVTQLARELEQKCAELIQAAHPTIIEFLSHQEAQKYCRKIWQGLPEPLRMARWNHFGIPCGGTHVAHTGEVGTIKIRGIKSKKGRMRIGYDLLDPLN